MDIPHLEYRRQNAWYRRPPEDQDDMAVMPYVELETD